MQFKKFVYLSLAFLLPIGLFLFLKFFGKNEFSVPVFYESGAIVQPAGCDLKLAPYRIAPNIVAEASLPKVIVLRPPLDNVTRTRLNDTFAEKITIHELDSLLDNKKKCIFITQSIDSLVLLDDQNYIRGYYKAGNRDEMDRLVVELKILLKKY
jgi:hypothetical protein